MLGVTIKVLLLHIILPALLTWLVSEWFRKMGWICFGDMLLDDRPTKEKAK